MGRRATHGQLDRNGITFIQTKLLKSNCVYCSKCPNKLFAESNEEIIFGTGTISTNIMIILPTLEENYFDNANIINLLASLYNKVTSRNIFEDIYITFATKCHKLQDYNTFTSAFNNCKTLLKYEIDKINPQHIILFGSILHNLFGDYDNFGFITVHKLINPNVFYTNKDLWEVFKKEFMTCIYNLQ